MEALFSSGLLIIAVVGIYLLFKIFKKPIKLIFKLLWHAASGFLLLLVVNIIGANIGFVIEITLVRAILVGFLGIPGALALIYMQIKGIGII